MSQSFFSILTDRVIMRLSGADKAKFLQGLVTNDVYALTGDPEKPDDETGPKDDIQYQCLLTPQGRYLYDFFLLRQGDDLLIDVAKDCAQTLFTHLRRYKLRADVALSIEADQWRIAALYHDDAAMMLQSDNPDLIMLADPRLTVMGQRLYQPMDLDSAQLQGSVGPFVEKPQGHYERHMIRHGIPSEHYGLLREKSLMLESNMDFLHALSWDKGCYMGQELTARTKYRGLVKKRLFKVVCEDGLLENGKPIMAGDKEIGEILAHDREGGDIGLAMIRLERWGDAIAAHDDFWAGAAKLIIEKPAYLKL